MHINLREKSENFFKRNTYSSIEPQILSDAPSGGVTNIHLVMGKFLQQKILVVPSPQEYDGREKGGTLFTMRAAHVQKREIRVIEI